ncbi:MAG: DUF2513 domain-containing protein [Woeseiaceae bacterium]|nr:DUF2513 domain-containing protein [Woeseiaceae bacterium]
MIRDMDLLRKAVLAIEHLPSITDSYSLHIDDADQDEVAYHCLLLHDDGLIRIAGEPYPGNRIQKHKSMMIERLTSQGHDFRSQIKEDVKWSVTKSIVAATKQFTMEVLRSNLTRMTNEGWDERMGQISQWILENPLQ